MGIEQAIYTSCRTGIEKATSGFQVYSYSCSMKSLLEHTNVGNMIRYEPPTCGREPYPTKFAYDIVEKKRGIVSLATNTYIGKDYAEDCIRRGNYLSHVFALNEVEMKEYPCCYKQSQIFRTNLTKEEVCSDEKPKQLSRLQQLIVGDQITLETVTEFVNEGERAEGVKRLLQYVLSSEREKVILCDEREEIPYWIAAVTMALPVSFARKLSFSTYEYDPLICSYRLVGVASEGTKYDTAFWQIHKEAYVFDVIHNVYSEGPEEYQASDTANEFFELVELSYTISRGCLEDFHQFLDGYTYCDVGSELLDGYRLYCFLQAVYTEQYERLEAFTKEEVAKLFHFAQTYAREETRRQLITDMIRLLKQTTYEEKNTLDGLIHFLLSQVEAGKMIRDRLVAPLFTKFYYIMDTFHGTMEEFKQFFKTMEDTFLQLGVSLTRYLFLNTTKEVLVETISHREELFMSEFFFSLLLKVIKEEHLQADCLLDTRKQGACLKAIIQSMTKHMDKESVAKLYQMVASFSYDVKFMTYALVNIEQWFKETQEKGAIVIVRTCYQEYFVTRTKMQRFQCYQVLLELNEEKQIPILMGQLFEQGLEFVPWFGEVTEFMNTFLSRKESLREELYESSFLHALKDREHIYQNMLELFDYVSDQKGKNSLLNRIVPYITANLPILPSTERDRYIVKKLYAAQCVKGKKNVDLRVGLAHFTIALEERMEALPRIYDIYGLYQHELDVKGLSKEEYGDYINVVAEQLATILFYTKEVCLVGDVFHMEKEPLCDLFEQMIETLTRLSKKYRQYEPLVCFYIYANVQNIDIDACFAFYLKKYGIRARELQSLFYTCQMEWMEKEVGRAEIEQGWNRVIGTLKK